MAAIVNLEFLDGEVLKLPVSTGDVVRDLLKRAHADKPAAAAATLQLVSDEVQVQLSEPATSLVGKCVSAIYGPQLAYLVRKGEDLVLIDECNEEWTEEIACKMQVAEDCWVPSPSVDNPNALRNLAKEAEGVTLWAIPCPTYWKDDQKLLNLLRLGSTVGEPLYVPMPMSVRGTNTDRTILYLDFGRIVSLQRVGAICSGTNNYREWFEVWSTIKDDPAEDDWESWGKDLNNHQTAIFFLDREATRVRRLKIKGTSGRIPGGRVQHLFAYGCDDTK